jgi:hypothetical protein
VRTAPSESESTAIAADAHGKPARQWWMVRIRKRRFYEIAKNPADYNRTAAGSPTAEFALCRSGR